MKYKYIYVSSRTKEKVFKKQFSHHEILFSYSNMKKNKNRWGILLLNNNKIIGNSSIMCEEEEGIKYALLVWVFIGEQFRNKKLCYELVKRTIIKNESKKKNNLIKVVIAGGEPILKCLIKVFKELKYKIKTYKSNKEDITNLKSITYEQALKIEKANYDDDIWQTLFFEK